MKTIEELKETKLFKAFIIVFIAACLFQIFGAGYSFGQWVQSKSF